MFYRRASLDPMNPKRIPVTEREPFLPFVYIHGNSSELSGVRSRSNEAAKADCPAERGLVEGAQP